MVARAYGRTLLVAVVVVMVVAAVGGAEELAPELLYQQVSPSVVRLEVETSGGETVVGNAFMAVRDGVAVTACHLLLGAQRVTAVFPSGESFEVSGLIDRDEARNAALVRVKVVDRPLLSLNIAEPPVGSKVYVIGPPEGLEFGFADGMLAQARTVDGVRTYQFTASSPLARSGGPLLDGSGNVLGVVAIRVKDGARLNFAVPAAYAAGLDSSLPTQPWGDVQWEGAAEAPIAKAAQDATDGQLAEALVAAFDLVVAIRYADNVTNGTGFQQGVPKLLYTYQQQAESQLRAISQLKSQNPQRQKLIQETVQVLADGLKAADLFINAIVIAQSSTWGRSRRICGIAARLSFSPSRSSVPACTTPLGRCAPARPSSASSSLHKSSTAST